MTTKEYEKALDAEIKGGKSGLWYAMAGTHINNAYQSFGPFKSKSAARRHADSLKLPDLPFTVRRTVKLAEAPPGNDSRVSDV